MKKLLTLIAFLLGCFGLVTPQTLKLSVSGITNGGGSSSAATIGMLSSSGDLGTSINSGGGGGSYFGLVGGVLPAIETATGIHTGLTNVVEESWNLVSLSLRSDVRSKATLFPTALSAAYRYSGTYVARESLLVGEGYWLKFAAADTTRFTGNAFVRETIAVAENWNIIGGVSYRVPVANITAIPPTTIVSNIFGYSNGTSYFVADTLEPGRGYWIRVHNAGKLIIDVYPSFAAAASTLPASLKSTNIVRDIISDKSLDTLWVMDANGRSRVLLFSTALSLTDLDLFELPPAGPMDVMDVRYATNRMLAVAGIEPNETIIRVSSAEYPLKIRWKTSNAVGTATFLVDKKETPMRGTGFVSIENPEASIRLMLTRSSSEELPREFALQQNYPNPFNPATLILYQLPFESNVSLKVYNILGQEVVTLVDELQSAGYKHVSWHAGSMASGVYYYLMDAQGPTDTKKRFIQVKKMVLMK